MSEENGGRPDSGSVFADDLDLTDKQLQAVGPLVKGDPITDVADQIEVDPSTIHRWKNDADFEAALNREREKIQRRVHGRLMELADQAIETVEHAVAEEGDVRTAMKILKGLGLLDGERPSIGPTDPDGVRTLKKLEDPFGPR